MTVSKASTGSGAPADLWRAGILADIMAQTATVGALPPSPPTLRGRFGATLIRLIQRLLFWYTPQISRFHSLVAQSASELVNLIASLKEQSEALQKQASDLQSAFTRAALEQGRLETGLEILEARVGEGLTKLRHEFHSLNSGQAHLETELARLLSGTEDCFREMDDLRREIYQRLRGVDQQLGKSNETFEKEHLAAPSELRDRISIMERGGGHLREQSAFYYRRLARVLEEARAKGLLARRANETTDLDIDLNALYVSFEDQFRGTREDIKDRLRCYLDRLLPYRSVEGFFLDLGCGRGEWLELMRDEGFRARGIDANAIMVESCKIIGLDVVQADVLEYLRKLPSASVNAITGFHILEHLASNVLIQVLDETVRVLRPDGTAIFETPNPANLIVGSHTFYLDPTHIHPLPAQTLAFLGKARGLCEVETVPLHPYPASFHFRDESESMQRLNELLFGPQDYALIGRKPVAK